MRIGDKTEAITKTHSVTVFGKAKTIQSHMGGDAHHEQTLFLQDDRPRRLTPREQERCFGLEDDYTRWTDEGKQIADSPRYEALGDGVVANVSEWLGRGVLGLPRL
jgi:site-specific DNA-cytosine methylase